MNPKLTINGLFFIWSAKVVSNNNIEYFLTNIKYNNLKLIKKYFLLLQDFQIFFYYLQKILYICCNHFDQCCKDFFYLAIIH